MNVDTDTIEYLYCPVWPDKVNEAIEKGIALQDESSLMLVNRDTYAVGFIKMTGGIRLNGVTDFEFEGRSIAAPSFDKFHTGAALKIKVASLKQDILAESEDDYSSTFYPEDMKCFEYRGDVLPSMIDGFVEYNLNSSDVPMAP
jgi:hypothetical protein